MHVGSMCIHILRTWQLVETLGVAQIVYAEVKEQRGEKFCFLYKRIPESGQLSFCLFQTSRNLFP